MVIPKRFKILLSQSFVLSVCAAMIWYPSPGDASDLLMSVYFSQLEQTEGHQFQEDMESLVFRGEFQRWGKVKIFEKFG
jgi:hypothetical protein